jgi:catechol 2,3-dioxygenase-like lactoylglutathione lyase family enzyme
MTLSLGAVVLNVKNIDRAAEFWSKALGYDAQPDNPAFLGPKNDLGPRLHLDQTDRTHLDVWIDRTDSDLESEVDHLITLGARRVDWNYPPDADFVVLADPDDNLFCVIK